MKTNDETVIGKIANISEFVDKMKEKQNQAEEGEWKIEIVKVDNGYIVKETNFESDEKRTITTLIEEKEIFGKDDNQYQPTKSEKEAMSRLLYYIADYFGFHYDKFSKHNLKISFDKKGHKVE